MARRGFNVPPAASAALRRGQQTIGRHAWLGIAMAAGLVFVGAVDFEPPALVRSSGGNVSSVVGDAPLQEFAPESSHAQAVQLRAALRRYADPHLDVLRPTPESEAAAQLLSSPVVTTIYGMQATIEQTVKLPGARRELDVVIKATPRVYGRARGKKSPPVVVDHTLTVRSRQAPRWFGSVESHTHVRAEGKLFDLGSKPYRVVFRVGDELFSLDLEMQGRRP